ncbi:MAG: ferrous iron transport protein B [Pelosinus sp.]|nr:ferrous iron transport protein B [Pelosinus sp.]
MKKVVLVGSPNVGKSVIFNYLTGSYVTVSNYPGTTVDIARGRGTIYGEIYEVIDTPGLYSLMPLTEEEAVTRKLLEREQADIIIHVIDAKHIRRMLPMTLQLLEAGLPVVLVLNIMDEAERLGMRFDFSLLSALLGIPVIGAAAAKRLGLREIMRAIKGYRKVKPVELSYQDTIEQFIAYSMQRLEGKYGTWSRLFALFFLQGDQLTEVSFRKEKCFSDLAVKREEAAKKYDQSLDYVITLARQNKADKVVKEVVRGGQTQQRGFLNYLGRLAREPLAGIPILLFVLYFGLYLCVGKLGAGLMVDYLDNTIFSQFVNPWIKGAVCSAVPWLWLQSLLVGEYGIFTLGFRYAFVIILPITGTFFFVFAFLEDCGYLPRLAMLVDRVFKYFGLNGRAVIPVVLGFGCGSMAVMVTRTLETRRERLIATALLAIAIPCSAQLGLVLAMLSKNITALMLWGGCVLLAFAVIGTLSTRILPGLPSTFYMEIPPMRVPAVANLFTKAYTRMMWYFLEILPVFIITSMVLWVCDFCGVLTKVTLMVQPFMEMVGLPAAAANVFLLGFFRRDYGAAGLYDLSSAGLLGEAQLLIAAVMLTLFVPCVAQVAVMYKERGSMATWVMVLLAIIAAAVAGRGLYLLLQIVPLL